MAAFTMWQPENIILDEASGKVKLVDFGAVQDAASAMQIGSTVVGTVLYSLSINSDNIMHYTLNPTFRNQARVLWFSLSSKVVLCPESSPAGCEVEPYCSSITGE